MQLNATKLAVNGYQILSTIGSGATATVYKARSEKDNAIVALKIFHPNLTINSDFLKRVQSEFKVLNMLQDTHITKIYEPIESTNIVGFAMEFVDGESLASLQNELPYTLPELSVTLIIEVLKALEHAHSQMIIHRDLKPSNILISKDGQVFVTDFGLAKLTDASSVTQTGTILGSPDYMSPEQARGEALTTSTDLFSVSSMLYTLVTGTKPFAKSSVLATLAAVQKSEAEYVSQRNPKVSAKLAAIIHKGLSLSPHNRYDSAREYRQALENYLRDLGLDHTQFNLMQWKRSKSDFIYSALRTIAEHLTENAQRFVRTHQYDQAMSSLSHLSLVSPDSETLSLLLTEVQNHNQNHFSFLGKKKNRIALLLLLVFTGTFGALYKTRKQANTTEPVSSSAIAATPQQEPPSRAITPTPTVTPEVAQTKPIPTEKHPVNPVVHSTKTVQAPSRVHHDDAISASTSKDKSPATPTETITDHVNKAWNKVFPHSSNSYQRVKINIPDDVTLYFDDEEVDTERPFYARPGPHKLKLVKDGFKPIYQDIDIREDEPTLIRVK